MSQKSSTRGKDVQRRLELVGEDVAKPAFLGLDDGA